jgi:hypothetical protein
VAAGGTKEEVFDAWEQEGLVAMQPEKLVIRLRQQEDSTDVNSSVGNSPASQEVANTGLITTTLRQDNYFIKVVGLQDISFVGHHIIGSDSFTIRSHNTTVNNTKLVTNTTLYRNKYLHTQIITNVINYSSSLDNRMRRPDMGSPQKCDS